MHSIGIIRHKAASEIRRRQAEADCIDTYANNRVEHSDDDANADLDSLRKEIFEAAVDQLMADDRISSATREIFRHVAIEHEKPTDVARQFGVTRNNVDEIKARMIARLKDLIAAMVAARA